MLQPMGLRMHGCQALPAPLVPMGPDSLNYLGVNADELTERPLGVSFPPSGQKLRGERPVPEVVGVHGVWRATPAHTRTKRSHLLSVVWLLYGNDHDVAVPSVFL